MIEKFGAAYWIWFGKYVLRIGRPFAGYRYAWRPLISFFRVLK
jgi:hypothetical protein